MERQGLISRFFSRTSDGDRQQNASEAPPPQGREVWADNATRPVHALVKSVLQEPRCLIVTGYQDFLSSLTIVLDAVQGLAERPEGSIRIVFGSNTDGRRHFGGGGRSVAQEC